MTAVIFILCHQINEESDSDAPRYSMYIDTLYSAFSALHLALNTWLSVRSKDVLFKILANVGCRGSSAAAHKCIGTPLHENGPIQQKATSWAQVEV